MADFSARGCTLVDTTCGSVLNVWKNVERYAQDGFTAIIHGKVTARGDARHGVAGAAVSATAATSSCSIATKPPSSATTSATAAIRDAFLARFADAVSPGFDPDRDLERVGCANQTTMLMSESLEIGEMVGAAMRDRYGEDALAKHFRAFDTICSATQERQDAVEALLDSEPRRPDDRHRRLQQQQHRATSRASARTRVRTYHIADPACLLSADADPASPGRRAVDGEGG